MIAAGANLKKMVSAGHYGVNVVYVGYSLPILKDDKAYNLYAIKGRHFLNSSADYGYTYRNFHLFGEFAVNRRSVPGDS